MRIKYDLEDNYFDNYNEANGVISLIPKLKKNSNAKVHTYLEITIFYSFIFLTISLFLLVITVYFKMDILRQLAEVLIGASVFLMLFYYLWLKACSKLEINSKKGTLVIDEEGITDENANGNKTLFSYNNIKAIVITNNLIVFSLNTPLMLFIPNKNKEKVIKTIRKYSDVLIIDKSN